MAVRMQVNQGINGVTVKLFYQRRGRSSEHHNGQQPVGGAADTISLNYVQAAIMQTLDSL
ncbi:MAG: hypothetical protein IPL08_06655 [Saprospiraceae bacterium]|nr:hypothetical protein [Saprospiraceae bacterium]